MAKENYISLKGQLRSDVQYVANPVTGDINRAIFQLTVMRRDIRNRANDFSPKVDRPVISTEDPELIKEIQGFKLHDIIEVKGTFKTMHVTKHKQCPDPACAKVNIFTTPTQVINPVYLGRCYELNTNIEGTDYLRKCAEVSNIAKVIGRVCLTDDQIIIGETERGNKFAKYQIAINRKLFDSSSEGVEDHSDYPVVYSYDDIADQDEAMLCQGALIYIDGYVHMMTVTQNVECCACGKQFPVKQSRMNLTPYSVEYLRDYKNDGLESTHVKNGDGDAKGEELDGIGNNDLDPVGD